jgi:Ran GTPase-activating protein (RanGAP) involved in mRNA processing and transport
VPGSDIEKALRRLYNFVEDGAEQSLDLAGLKLNNLVVEEVIKTISSSLRVRHLGLCACGLSDSHVVRIATALEKDGVLENLDVSANEITALGISALANTIAKHPMIEEVNLGSNRLGNSAALAIAGAIERSQALSVVRLDGTEISNAGARAIATAAQKSKSIRKMTFGECPIGSSGVRALAELSVARPEIIIIGLRGHNEAEGKLRLKNHHQRVKGQGHSYPYGR